MTRIAYVNGRYLPHTEAAVHVEDRGYQFADGVYEVMAFYNRILIDEELHMQRLFRSLDGLGIPSPTNKSALKIILKQFIARNSLQNGSIYLQVTRGVARRDHIVKSGMLPSLVITINRERFINPQDWAKGVEVITRPDNRWQRRDIKSVSLLANAMLKNEAAKLGKRETLLVGNDGKISEGSVSNVFIIDKKGTLVTPPVSEKLLSGITRHRVLEVARELQIPIREAHFTAEEVATAEEVFITSSTSHMVPVTKIDETRIGKGKPGAVTRRIFENYVDFIEKTSGKRIWEA